MRQQQKQKRNREVELYWWLKNLQLCSQRKRRRTHMCVCVCVCSIVCDITGSIVILVVYTRKRFIVTIVASFRSIFTLYMYDTHNIESLRCTLCPNTAHIFIRYVVNDIYKYLWRRNNTLVPTRRIIYSLPLHRKKNIYLLYYIYVF